MIQSGHYKQKCAWIFLFLLLLFKRSKRGRREMSPSVLEDLLGLLDLCGRCLALPKNIKTQNNFLIALLKAKTAVLISAFE